MIILEIISLILAAILLHSGASHAQRIIDHNKKHSDLKLKFGIWELSAVIGAAWITFYFIAKALMWLK